MGGHVRTRFPAGAWHLGPVAAQAIRDRRLVGRPANALPALAALRKGLRQPGKGRPRQPRAAGLAEGCPDASACGGGGCGNPLGAGHPGSGAGLLPAGAPEPRLVARNWGELSRLSTAPKTGQLDVSFLCNLLI